MSLAALPLPASEPFAAHDSDPAAGPAADHLIGYIPRPGNQAGTTFDVPGLPGSFSMRYLPEIELGTGQIVACEALLRWQHPDFGLLRPVVSLDGSGWHDHLPDIEAWSMTEVCHQIASWADGPLLQVAMNVSAEFLTGPGFFESLDQAIEAADIDPARLAIDVPVQVAVTEPGLLRCIAGQLVERGVGVVIDGVGGIRSHPVLTHLPASVWKVALARRGARRAGLHPSIAELVAEAHSVGVVTTAKAVEDLEALRAARELGFDRAFGYAVSPAVEPAAMQVMAGRGTVSAGPLFGAPHRLRPSG